jgi:hypothetical protein
LIGEQRDDAQSTNDFAATEAPISGAISMPITPSVQSAALTQTEDPGFVKLSATLTGVDALPASVQQLDTLGVRKSLSQVYWERLSAAYPAEFAELMAVWNTISGEPDPEAALAARLSATDAAGQRLRVAARQVCKIWYLSSLDDPSGNTNAPLGGDIGQYQHSVIWKVIGAPVTGYSDKSHGYWTEKPAL